MENMKNNAKNLNIIEIIHHADLVSADCLLLSLILWHMCSL